MKFVRGVVFLVVFLSANCFGRRASRSGNNRNRLTSEPTVTRDAGSCSYVVNIPAPDTCKVRGRMMVMGGCGRRGGDAMEKRENRRVDMTLMLLLLLLLLP